jgi:adenosylcobinamide-GDP ribazoletransferase
LSLRREAALLITALQFLTSLPTPKLRGFQPAWITRSARYYPLAGQLVGGLSAAVLLGAAQLWPSAVAAVLALAAGVLATGAFHEDGLADTADGLFGGSTPARRLEIMKDSRVGTYGVLALLAVLALKATALATVAPVTAAAALLAAHGLGRGAAVAAMRLTPYAPGGRATKWTPAERVRNSELAVAIGLAAWPLMLLPARAVAGGLAGVAICAVGVGVLVQRRLGGHTGDVLGAVEQMAEVGFLLGVSACA